MGCHWISGLLETVGERSSFIYIRVCILMHVPATTLITDLSSSAIGLIARPRRASGAAAAITLVAAALIRHMQTNTAAAAASQSLLLSRRTMGD